MKKLALFALAATLILSGGLLPTGCSREEDESIPWYEDVATLKADFAYALSQTPLPSEISTTLMPINENDPDLEMLFRPASDPSITTTTSGVEFPSWADENYTVGETNFRESCQQSVAYVGDGACPWTQLGYTYDWHHNADPKGLSEYVATVGALALVKNRQGSWTFMKQL